jgi:predicted GNAT family N-acyltransferase
LATDQSVRGQRLGETLLINALQRALRASEEVASYAVVVDAINEAAKAFYLKYEFIEFQDNNMRLFLPMETIATLRL